MAPPELAGDAPVADALEPLGVVVAAALGDEPQGTVAIFLERGARERRHPDEPLVGEPRLHHGAAAIAVADGVAVGLHLLQQPGRLELGHDPRAGLIPVEALEPVGRREADARLGGHDVDHGQVVPPADLEVGRVVRRRHLHRARAEGGVHRVVRDDRDRPVDHGQHELAPDQVPIALVLGMHRHRRVAQHGLGPGRRHRDVAAPVGERIAQVPDLPVGLLLLRFLIGERGEAAGAPVDDVVAAIDQPLLVERDEGLAHRAAESPSSSVK